MGNSHNLTGITWDHARGLDSVVNSNQYIQDQIGTSIEWSCRSLLAFGDQKIEEFYKNYDLMVIDYPHIPDAVSANTVLALEDFISAKDISTLAAESVGNSYDSYAFQGKHWAFALDSAAQVSAYRPDMSDYSPITWEDVIAIGKSGKLLWPYKPVDAFSTFATLCAQLGSPLKVGENLLNKSVATEALTLMLEITHLVPEFCSKFNPIDTLETLAKEADFTHAVALYGYSNYSRKNYRKHTIFFDDIPSFDMKASGAILGGTGIAISSASNNPNAAFAAALELTGAKVQSSVYTLSGGQPGNLRAWKNMECNLLTNNFFQNTLRTLERAWTRPNVIGWPDIQMAISKIIYTSLIEKKIKGFEVDRISQILDINQQK